MHKYCLPWITLPLLIIIVSGLSYYMYKFEFTPYPVFVRGRSSFVRWVFLTFLKR